MDLMPTPPRPLPSCYVEEAPETPGPIRARVNNLQNQVSELVRKEHAATRKHRSETSGLDNTIATQKAHLADNETSLANAQKELERCKNQGKAWQAELARCKSEGDGMRDELNLYSMVQQQKALLVLAQEQMQVIELEQRLVQAEAARIMRDHKITLFKAKENDLVVELAEKDAQLEELEVSLAQANTSLAHQRAADSKTSKLLASSQDKQLARAQSDLEDARVEVTRLEERVESLETKVRGLKQREKEARAELDGWLREEKGKEGSVRLSACLWFSGVDVIEVDKEKRELQTAVRSAQSELQKKNDEFADVQEELSAFRESSKEREKALKAKYRAATEERERLASIEEELETLKVTASSSQVQAKKAKSLARSRSESLAPSDKVVEKPREKASVNPAPPSKVPTAKPVKDKPRKASLSPVFEEESDEEVMPKKKARKADKPSPMPRSKAPAADSDSGVVSDIPAKKPDTWVKPKAPLRETGANAKTKNSDKDEEEAGGLPEKKKKRKLFGAPPTFTWDPIMNSADGVIPAYLSPVKPPGTGTIGAIPRIGFPSVPSSRSFGRC